MTSCSGWSTKGGRSMGSVSTCIAPHPPSCIITHQHVTCSGGADSLSTDLSLPQRGKVFLRPSKTKAISSECAYQHLMAWNCHQRCHQRRKQLTFLTLLISFVSCKPSRDSSPVSRVGMWFIYCVVNGRYYVLKWLSLKVYQTYFLVDTYAVLTTGKD